MLQAFLDASTGVVRHANAATLEPSLEIRAADQDGAATEAVGAEFAGANGGHDGLATDAERGSPGADRGRVA